MSQFWTSSLYQNLCIQVLHDNWTKECHQESSGPWVIKNVLASCLKMLRVHQLNAQFIWSCMSRVHDNLVLADIGQEKISQHRFTGKLAVYHQNSLGTPFCFLSWNSPLFLDYFFKRHMTNKEGRNQALETGAGDGCLGFWPWTSPQVFEQGTSTCQDSWFSGVTDPLYQPSGDTSGYCEPQQVMELHQRWFMSCASHKHKSLKSHKRTGRAGQWSLWFTRQPFTAHGASSTAKPPGA